MATKSSTVQRDKISAGRFGVFGDLPVRGVSMAAKTCPFFLEPVILFGFTVIAFVLLKAQRRAIRDNLKVLCPESGYWRRWGEVFSVLYEFATSISDAAYVRCGRDMLTWEIENPAAFEKMIQPHPKGAILLTAHMGNYDLAGSLFSDRFSAPVHSVRAPERDPLAQEVKEKELAADSSGDYVIHFNKGSEDILGLELAKALSKGEYVAIQGDRVLFDVSSMDAVVPGQKNTVMKIPAGPFVLGQISGAPVFPLFVKRSGYRRYCVLAYDPIFVANDRARRKKLQNDGLEKWMNILTATLRKNRRQWLVFEPAFVEHEGVEGSQIQSLGEGVKEDVRRAVIESPGWLDAHIGAALWSLMIAGASLACGSELLDRRSLLFLVPAIPIIVFLTGNFLGALTTLVTMYVWSGVKTPWVPATIFLGAFLTAFAVALFAMGGLFLKAVAAPWLIWISVRSLKIMLRP